MARMTVYLDFLLKVNIRWILLKTMKYKVNNKLS